MRKVSAIISTLTVLLISVSCAPSVPKVEYDMVASSLSSAQSQVSSLQTDLTSSQSQVKSLQADLSYTQSQVKSFQTGLSASQDQVKQLQSNLSSIQDKNKQAVLKLEIINSILLPELKGQQLTQAQELDIFLQWRDKVNSSGDPQLKAKFQTILSSVNDQQLLIGATADFFIYLLESLPSALQ